LNFRAADITRRIEGIKTSVRLRAMNRVLVCGLLVGLVGWLSADKPADGRVPPQGPPPAPITAPAQGPRMLPIPVRPVYVTACYPHTARAAEPDARPLVWVVDGAGDLKGCSNALIQVNATATAPVELSVFPWSHGYRQLLKDQVDMDHARAQGTKLAAAICERQAREPGRRVVLVAHSAGCAVALTASETLPPDSIDRMILLAPSVSSGYDVRPALWADREGLDVFCSKKDWVALGFVTRVVGTVDKFGAKAAGRHGFQPTSLREPEVTRLRQHFWTPEVAWTGNTGGHHGALSPAFLTAYVFPLIGASVR
jgi:hypothetical protein